MKASQVIQRVFEYLKYYFHNMGNNNSNFVIPDISVCDLKADDSLSKPLICVLLIRDAVAGQFVRQDRVSVELQIVCYAPTFYELGSANQLDELVRDAMLDYPNVSAPHYTLHKPPSNFNQVRRFLANWIDSLSAFQSRQIYQFHIVDN